MVWIPANRINFNTTAEIGKSIPEGNIVYSPFLAHSCDSSSLLCPCTDGWIRIYDRVKLTPKIAVPGIGSTDTPVKRGIYQVCCAKGNPNIFFSQAPEKKETLAWDIRTKGTVIKFKHSRVVTALDSNISDTCLVVGTRDDAEIWFIYLNSFKIVLLFNIFICLFICFFF